MSKRRMSVGQQTWALLCKNCLKKWRMKRQTLLEWLFSFLLVLFLYLFFSNLHQVHDTPQMSSMDLGRVDSFNDTNYVIAFAPESKTTQEIMNKVASAPFLKGRTIMGWPDEKSMDELDLNYSIDAVRVIFTDTFSYHLKFSWGHRIPMMKEHRDHSAHCQAVNEKMKCEGSEFWEKGFVAFQAAINAAIIEIATNHSVMEQLMSVTGVHMKILPFVAQGGVATDFFIFFCIISFSTFIYYVSVNVTQERQYITSLMTMMGLRESAFWLSWGLMYAGFILIMATLMALIVKSAQIVVLTGFVMVFTLFLLYGLSLITLAFLMSVLIKKPFLTGLVVFLLIVFWGILGFPALYTRLPAFLEWTLCLLSPFAFTVGMAQLIHLDYDVNSNAHLDSSQNPYLIIATLFMLVFDTLLYLVLTLYFDKILPAEYGHRCSPLFFLKSCFWFQHGRANHVVLENETDSDPTPNDCFEPVSPEFCGKEAIRIKNLKKEYAGKCERVEALKGVVFDIYEGQITALLGHSGAGKTTLLNILSGLSVPTSGSVTVYNHTLSRMADIENISKFTGFCPQSNVQFGFLTVKENLRLFAKIKGILPHEVEKEVQRVVQELEMENIQDILAQNLSGGQNRKLTFGIAILGDPQVLLLDEPTAGLDPLSRHRIWNLLKEGKSDRVILFSTQFIDEADILADRKVFISNGKLKCAGSSLFLKKKWGIGYHLSLHLNERCDPESITSLVKQHISDAKLTAQSEEKLVYILPLERTNKFPELYRDLDRCSNQGIEDYGVSITTLNEVFLKLEGKSTIDESDIGIWGQLQTDGAKDIGSLVELEQVLSSFHETRKTISGVALWRQQVCAIAKVRFLKLKKERKSLWTILLLFGISFIPQLLEHLFYESYQKSYPWELSPNTYFLSPGQQPQDPLTHLLVINKTGSTIDNFLHSLRRQNIAIEVDAFGTRNGTDDPSYNGAIIVSGDEKDHRFSIACNTKRLNCFPVLLDVISNGLLGIFNSSEHIQTDRSTFFEEHMDYEYGYRSNTFFWIPMAASFTPYIAMSSIGDYKKKAHSQLRISGLYPSAYWFGQALVDVSLYFLILLLMQIMDYIFSPEEIIFIIQNLLIQILCSIGYVSSLVFLTYVISFIFRNGRKNSGIWSFFFLIVVIFSIVATDLNEYGFLGLFFGTMLIPPFTLIGSLFIFSEISPDSMDYLGASESEIVYLALLIPYLHFLIFLFILRCLEMNCRKKLMRKDPVFRISPRSNAIFPNPEEPEGEEEDIQMERMRTVNAMAVRDFDETPVIIASCLRKEYAGKKKNCFSKRKKKIATRNVSFCVKKGEVIGLLGHNGAGKSTTIKMITGDTKPTAGQVILKGSGGGEPLGFLGYCPQENALWPNLTVRQHLEVYAAVKGLRKGDAMIAITRLVDALKLQDQLKAPVKTLSEGIKRKLCFVLSILGNPSVVLLDEPSTGMDPEGQQQMWQVIRATFRNTERGALLTTHYMAEAEAVCDRVAIMVSGRLRCIGSIQHLKSKFGKDYLLEMKLKNLAQMEPLHAEILRLFPQAAQQERFSSLMVYKLPVEDVRPLSQAFFKLEIVKQSFDLEEYSLSQSTLEQVFLELSKEQELGDLEEDFDPSVKWKLLLQEEP
ncbi:ATP-binding cassette sub-family A member 9 [Homo sapiens]|uniref:ATP-binding cassette sub-family A member 9 n=2 Tax=Homo sapiens TaxID=9606 RepID=ABCA9_HUMAN|nr:ATP-binding cassette sub-family A member 9 [Homo sapiens]Q8IUA7.1 RecName: Full=ATP-binding cassette sub-family A member 9 [Homo sapiens]AAI67781.1 ATP-binding cassette, sub-family A (ABC1), member 9 [synthetic construct]AAN32751.1 ATP-binding cassette sub-family A member 9 [Homo sapiens]AAN32752.1 ATP-binding cassette sub-family A member 9 [Homo sapiens]|eukprot:NP_525022.2 ATP-binding cassette sub-family A member 9 [Homo sapiens]